jgi:hypothetical protein
MGSKKLIKKRDCALATVSSGYSGLWCDPPKIVLFLTARLRFRRVPGGFETNPDMQFLHIQSGHAFYGLLIGSAGRCTGFQTLTIAIGTDN